MQPFLAFRYKCKIKPIFNPFKTSPDHTQAGVYMENLCYNKMKPSSKG